MTILTTPQAARPVPLKSTLPEQWLVRAAQLFIALWTLYYIIQGLAPALSFDGFPVNGPFQLFDPLRRIAAGPGAGRDSYSFTEPASPICTIRSSRFSGGTR